LSLFPNRVTNDNENNNDFDLPSIEQLLYINRRKRVGEFPLNTHIKLKTETCLALLLSVHYHVAVIILPTTFYYMRLHDIMHLFSTNFEGSSTSFVNSSTALHLGSFSAQSIGTKSLLRGLAPSGRFRESGMFSSA
jgi:hypothetical protein